MHTFPDGRGSRLAQEEGRRQMGSVYEERDLQSMVVSVPQTPSFIAFSPASWFSLTLWKNMALSTPAPLH